MREKAALVMAAAVVFVAASTAPALAQELTEDGGRPWHYWIAPFVLAGAVLYLVAWGLGYWMRVGGGRSRR